MALNSSCALQPLLPKCELRRVYYQVLNGAWEFPGLGFDERDEFFSRLTELPRSTESRCKVSVRGQPGWIILDAELARAILNSPDSVKGRSKESQARAGGFAGSDDSQRSVNRRAVMTALALASEDRAAIMQHCRAVLQRFGHGKTPLLPAIDERAEALTESMLNHLLGVSSAVGLPRGLLVDEIRELRFSVEHPEAAGRSVGSSARRGMLGKLMGAAPSPFMDHLGSAGWGNDEIVDEVLALSLAGWESTAAAVTSGVSMGLPGPVTVMEVRELLRLYPPSWLLVRKCAGPIGGLDFTSDELLIISPWLIQHNEKGWESPHEFIPGRFASFSPRTWYFPFGAGPRRCPAERYAMVQIEICLELLLSGDVYEPGPRRVGLLNGRSSALISN